MNAYPILDALEVDYLYKSQEEWANMGSFLEDPFFKRIYQESRQFYQAMQDKPGDSITDVPNYLAEPERNANVKPIFNRVIKQVAERAAVLWFIDKQESDLDYLWEALRHFIEHGAFSCEDRRVGGHGLHADLETSDASYVCGFCLDTFRDLLPDDIKKGLIRRLVEDTLPGYLAGVEKGDWWRYANFNWGAALHGCNGVGALALWDSHRELAKTVLEQSLNGLAYIYDDLNIGGFCTEGQMYQTTNMGHMVEFLQPWYRLTGDHLGFLDNPYVGISGDFHKHMHGQDGQAINFSNMNAGTTERGNSQFYWWARHYNKPQWASYEDEIARPWHDTHGCFYNVSAFWYAEPHQAREVVKREPLFHFPGLDWLSFHQDKLWGAFRGGFNGGNHNHKSLGHFILGYGSDRFMIAAGYGAGQTEMHNLFTCGTQADSAKAPIVRTRTWHDGFWAVCDLKNAYLNRCDVSMRHIMVLEQKHFLIIDHIVGKSGRRANARWHMQSYITPEILDNGYVLKGEHVDCRVQFLDAPKPLEASEWDFKGRAIQRVSWGDPVDRVAAVQPTLISFDDHDCAWTCEDGIATVTLHGRTYTINLYDLTLHRS